MFLVVVHEIRKLYIQDSTSCSEYNTEQDV